MDNKSALRKAASKFPSVAAFADAVGVSQQLAWYWLNKGKEGVPAEYLLAVEKATGIPRHELRPDLAAIFIDPTSDHRKESAA